MFLFSSFNDNKTFVCFLSPQIEAEAPTGFFFSFHPLVDFLWELKHFLCFWGSRDFNLTLCSRLVWTRPSWSPSEDRLQPEVGFLWAPCVLLPVHFLSGCPRTTRRLQFLPRSAGRQQRATAGRWTDGASAWVTSGTRWAAAWWLNPRRWELPTWNMSHWC